MYRKVLVPLENSEESGSIVRALPSLVDSDGQVILFHVIQPGKTRSTGGFTVFGSQLEEEARSRAMVFLNRISGQLAEVSIASTCAVEISKAVPDCIANCASREGVDLIAMFTHARSGLAKLLKGSVAETVKSRSSVEVRAFGSSELAELTVK